MPRFDRPSLAVTDTLRASAAATVSGQTATLTGYGYVTVMRVQVVTSAISGTTPTLDVVLEDTLDGTNFYTIATFPQVTATGAAVLNVTAPFSDRIRVRWTVGGTTPSVTFAVTSYSM